MVADRYRLDERIGSGPMGEVWRGYDTRADWVVAVKVLGARAAGAATREVFRQHAQAAARVIHPNVAMVLDVGDHQGAPFLVMEFLTGLSLGEELAARGPLPIVEACDLVGQAAAGLDAAHRAGVVHGRVDPDSFRLAASGVLKVVGFGVDERAPAREGGPYVAPERTGGQAASAPGDVYALGCVAYELLCGRPPGGAEAAPGLGGATPDQGGAAQGQGGAAQGQGGAAQGQGGAAQGQGGAAGGPVPPSAIRAEVSPELDRLVLAMIAEDPAQRPASGESIRRALAAIARPKPAPGAIPVTGASLRDPGAQPGPGGQPGSGSQGFAAQPGSGPQPGFGAQPGPGPQPGSGAQPGFGVRPGSGATEVFPVGAGTAPGAGPGAAPRAGDTAVFQAADLEPGRDQPPSRKLILQLGIAVAVIAAVTVAMVMWAGAREEEPVAAPTPVATPSVIPSETYSFPSLPPSPTDDSTPGLVSTLGPDADPTSLVGTEPPPRATLGEAIPPGGYAKWLREFDESLKAQQSMGGIDPRVADKAREKLGKAADKYSKGQIDPTLNHIAGVYRDLLRAQQKGEMEPQGPASQFMREWQVPNG
ncbi:serine/threonine-protein kinase [Nonomuraea candida]|uniref:serine/threonine-protein kinase n=1 Tax=Nonomuraea candida TaxID=359159 RepID=UPI001470622B|nr:serine/threonine-protein kinase [Nonomuraea candida]